MTVSLADRHLIAKRLKQARSGTGLSLVKFAAAVSAEMLRQGERRGISKNIVVKIERGTQSPTAEMLRAWSTVTDEPLEFLLGTRGMGLYRNRALGLLNHPVPLAETRQVA